MKISNKTLVFLCSLALFLAVISSFALVNFITKDDEPSYTETQESVQTYVPETIEYEDLVSDPITDDMPDGISYRRVEEKTILDTKTASRLALVYPIFDMFGDKGLTDAINQIIADGMSEKQREFGQGMFKMLGTGTKVMYEINDFDITYIDQSFISILFNGFFVSYSETDTIDTGDYYFRYSLNIDLAEQSLITDRMLVSDFLLLKTQFTSGNMSCEYGIEGLLDYASYTDLFSQYSSLYHIYPSFYFTNEKLMMIISLTNDLGGNAVFSCSINDSRAFLNTDLAALQGIYS